jgi:hypothetical protein
MIRTLAMIAVAGFVLSVACLVGAVAIGGPDVITRAAWSGGHGWNVGWSDSDWDHHHHHGGGSTRTREIAWTGGDRLNVEVPGAITYVQASGPAKLTVEGPQSAVNDLMLQNGVLSFSRGEVQRSGDLTITLTAPNVSAFELHGSNKLTLQNYQQPKLGLNLTGDSEVNGDGRADSIDVDISGSANADLSDIKASDAAVRISGSGEAKVAPTNSAKVSISGSGDVYLTSHPAHVDTDISGSGTLHQGDDD